MRYHRCPDENKMPMGAIGDERTVLSLLVVKEPIFHKKKAAWWMVNVSNGFKKC